MRVLFILKKNETYGFQSYTRRSSGLWNSTRFIVESLKERGVHAHIAEVNDNNDIDRQLARHKPDLCVIEALWVVPEKFEVLERLHPRVKFFVHLHSHMPFLALEGIAMQWILDYPGFEVGLIANSQPSYEALRAILDPDELTFLPNVYRPSRRIRTLSELSRESVAITIDKREDTVDVACFGAVRPLKNQLLQALAAIKYARRHGKKLRFHINGTRVETGGNPVLKNLRSLFERQHGAELIEHPWYEPEDFLRVLTQMDIGLQVSLSETFNVVTADYVTAEIPIVVSKEVAWVSNLSMAEDDSVNSIVQKMDMAMKNGILTWWNRRLLTKFQQNSERMWYDFVKKQVEGD